MSISIFEALYPAAVPPPSRQPEPFGKGTRVAALFYSLIEPAKLCGVEPPAYLREATLRAVRDPGTVTLVRDFKSTES